MLAEKEEGVCFVGRLASYKYFNMDQVLWETGQVVLFALGAQPITLAPLTPVKPHLDGLITDFLLDQTVQAWFHNSLMQ